MNQNTVRALRLSRAWSQEHLAELASLSVRTIQRIENGGQASLETLSAIAAVFGLNVADLGIQPASNARCDEALDRRVAQARQRLNAENRFFRRALIWAIVCTGLAAVNLLSETERYWFLWPTLIWGAVLAFSGIRLFLLRGWLEKRNRRRLQQLVRK
ncbi:2TM domain-containing protein [Entomohabitans teleogrylli]|uniref:2TM domain-containing protein n=1 Tax=Entomohabitans teleogrylli TaxID=1384589 RepID=UPI00073DA267|nr:2TM domain-containing protein [Entomohabitans teleogrylli]